jgi:nitrite reductase/ring-hydroxylating ferredoxin subunit
MNNRRNFLKTACKPIVLATLGIPIIEACSKEDDSSSIDSPVNNQSGQNSSRNQLEINLDDDRFKDLKQIGGWLNFTSENILLVRISESEIRVFDNACPHQGARNLWSFDGSNFTCSNHNNSYSASCSGSLRCYEATLEENILTVEF